MGMMVIDTVLLGHHGTVDLAAVAVGGGIYIAVVFALVGIPQAVAPTVATTSAPSAQRGGGAAADGMAGLRAVAAGHADPVVPDPILALSTIEPAVGEKLRLYLRIIACGMPAALLYRPFIPSAMRCASRGR